MSDRAATLANVRAKYPQYADMSDDQLGNALAAKYPEYADLAAPQGNAVTRGYKAVAEPVTRAVAKGVEWLDTLQRGGLPFAALTPENTKAVAEAVVPQTPVEAGAAAGTLALPWLLPARVAGPVASRVARVAGGAVGGETGGQLAGEATGQGALVGGGGAAVGESVGAGASKLARALPWMKGAIAAQDERRLTNVVGDAVEPFAGRDLRSLGSGEGRKLLRTDREGRIAAIEQAIGNQPINVPSLGGPMPLRDALDALSNVGVRLGQHPADRSVRQVPDALDYKTIIGEIRAGLDAVDPSRKASAAFDTAQDVYRGGKTLIKQVLAQEGLYNVHGQFNSAAAQRILANPRRAELLRERVGDDVYGALVEAAYRGATPAAGRDKLASGAGGPLDAAREWARGTNTGATQVVGVPLRTILPNLGSQYVGRAPFSLPPALQAILDVALQKAGGAGLSGEQR